VQGMSSVLCSVLQCVAVCCSVLQCVAACCSVLQCVLQQRVAVHRTISVYRLCFERGALPSRAAVGARIVFSVLQCVAVCCSVLQCAAMCYSVLQCRQRSVCIDCVLSKERGHREMQYAKGMSPVYTSVLQCVAVCCSVLQCAAMCCSVLQCVAVLCSVLPCVAVPSQEMLYAKGMSSLYRTTLLCVVV